MKQEIMIVDDSEDELHLMQHIFAQVAPEVVVNTVLGGEEALEQLKDGRAVPRVMLLDLRMHGMSGVDVLRELKSDPRLCNIPVCTFSNGNVQADICDCYQAGASFYFQKPTGLIELRTFADCLVKLWFKYASQCDPD